MCVNSLFYIGGVLSFTLYIYIYMRDKDSLMSAAPDIHIVYVALWLLLSNAYTSDDVSVRRIELLA